MANYYSLVTPEEGLPCTPEEAAAMQLELERAEEADDAEYHGFRVDYDPDDGRAYLVAEEAGNWDYLPDAVLAKMGELITRAGKPYLEFGVAFTCSAQRPGSTGGTAFRILADGTLLARTETWGD